MFTIEYANPGPITDQGPFLLSERESPQVSGRDLLIEVRAVSVNPVDVKLRGAVKPEGGRRILGWDAAGIVTEAGPEAQFFRPGDKVYYAGALDRPGSNAQYQLVDERLAGPMPASLVYAEAAAIPLTAITAWEALFERMDVRKPVTGAANAVLIIGGAGGVGSMAIQLLRQMTDATVIATASRPESRDWAQELGAHYVIDHSRPMAPQTEALGIGQPGYVFSTSNSEQNAGDIAELIAPQGHFCLIDDPDRFDIKPFKVKSIAIHWEFMFTRSLKHTADMAAQHDLLAEVARMTDAGRLRSTMREALRPINIANLSEAHRRVETGHMTGKIVVADW